MLNQKEIINRIATKLNLPKNTIKEVINTLSQIIANEISNQNNIRIQGIGTFTAVETKQRIGKNPRSGELIKIPKRIKVRFRTGGLLKTGVEKATILLKLDEIAKLMVSELLLYNSNEIDEGIKRGDLEKRLENKLKDARINFLHRVPEGSGFGIEIFETAWVRFIEKRERALKAMK
jgi:DNA-binding protein HU-beta